MSAHTDDAIHVIGAGGRTLCEQDARYRNVVAPNAAPGVNWGDGCWTCLILAREGNDRVGRGGGDDGHRQPR